MNSDELSDWRVDVGHHLETLDMLINDRKILKNLIEEHLKMFFDWTEIKYSKDFSVITLKWAYGHNPIIKHENISKLEMDWIIRADYDDKAFKIVIVEVYPFGIEEDINTP